MKLDYRCRGIGCTQATRCRRFLTGDAAKRSTIPVAALDMRRTTEACQSFLPRQDAPVAGNAALCGPREAASQGNGD